MFESTSAAPMSASNTANKSLVENLRRYAYENADAFRLIAYAGRDVRTHLEEMGVMRIPNEMFSEVAPFVVTDDLIQNILEPVATLERMCADIERQFYAVMSLMLTLAEMQEASHV